MKLTQKNMIQNMGYNDASYLFGAKYHDLGKMYTQTFDENGVAHYYQHHNVGSYLALSQQVIDSETIDVLKVCFLINYHMLPFSWNTDKVKQKWKKIVGEEKFNMLLDFNKCDRAR